MSLTQKMCHAMYRRDHATDTHQVFTVNYERHLKRLMADYVRYYHDDRTHLGLAKQTPGGRIEKVRSGTARDVIAMPRLGGLHHRYDPAA